MASIAPRGLMTVEELYRMPDDGRQYELEAGRLLSEPLPAPRHGQVAAAVVAILRGFVRPRRLGVVLSNDTGFVLARSPDTVRGPDVSFVTLERYRQLEDPTKAFPGPPDLAVEVVSPSNTTAGIHAKVADYLAAGARLVWVVDPEAETVSVYASLLAPCTHGVGQDLDGGDVLPGFRVGVGEIFEI